MTLQFPIPSLTGKIQGNYSLWKWVILAEKAACLMKIGCLAVSLSRLLFMNRELTGNWGLWKKLCWRSDEFFDHKRYHRVSLWIQPYLPLYLLLSLFFSSTKIKVQKINCLFPSNALHPKFLWACTNIATGNLWQDSRVSGYHKVLSI